MNTTELITKAYYLSDVVSRELETVSGSQISDGLDLLNDLLAEKSAKGHEIPYYTHQSFNTVKGQEKYFIENLIDADVVTYNIGTVRYNMLRENRKYYFGVPRANNIESLPTTYTFERALGGSNLYLYYLPSDVYEVEITGKFALQELSLCEQIGSVLDKFYISYLKYALAERICDFNSISLSSLKINTLRNLENKIFEVSPPDMRIKKISMFGSDSYTNYGYANLGRGFVPPA